jgi:hypothetical protein
MFEAGASAYLSKGTAFNLVCDTIRQVFLTEQGAPRAQASADSELREKENAAPR